jgi:D-alanyl-D-alanine carboxypeptidase (penicillin-binding protein 5/6)
MLEYAPMHRRSWLCVLLLAAATLAHAETTPTVPAGLSLRAYIVYNVGQEQVLAAHNRDTQQPVASLTKLMTAILACERLRFDGRYILTGEEAETFGVETMRADRMLELMLVPSNNGVCRVVSRIVAGDEQGFVQLMNAKAQQLKLDSTRFANATGLPAGSQHSTLDDLLVLTRAALAHPQIRRAICRAQVVVGGQTYDSTLKDLYDRHSGLLGGKTGYTRAAGRCLVLLYTARGTNYIVITLGSKDVKAGFRDAEILLSHYRLYTGDVGAWE